MKCKRARGHTEGHEVKANCHMMAAFRGINLAATKTPGYDVCFTKNCMERSFVSNE